MNDARFKSMINRLTATRGDQYAMGWDSAVNGPNTTNCDFRLFNTPDNTRLWEQGKAAGEKFLAERAAGSAGAPQDG